MKRPVATAAPERKLDAGDAVLAKRLRGELPRPVRESRELVDGWIAGLRGKPVGKALRKFVGHAPVERLLAGIAEASPYLWTLVRADAARCLRLLQSDPDRTLSTLLTAAQDATAAARTQDQVMSILRRMKGDAALLIAFADIGGVWPVPRVVEVLTEVAETALRAAVDFLLRDAVSRRKLAVAAPASPETGSGYIVVAMGKMGGRELNYSSDIDLMVFFDPAKMRLMPGVEPGPFFVQLTRDLVKLLQKTTVDGYVFRVDLRLRPDPSSTQIAISTETALNYYESRGQNWERAALIKARPCAGDLVAGERLLRELSPFVWRKYLDFATIADVHAMKQQIHAYRGHGEIAVEGHNIKLGRGGIREIEFFVQTQQLIAGGRHPELRGRSTIATLTELAASGWIDAAARDELEAAYYFLRRVEHRLQMRADEQTHTLPSDAAAMTIFARFLGFKGREEFAGALLAHLHAVEWHYVQLFERAFASSERRQRLPVALEGAEGEAFSSLAQLGFRQPAEVIATVGRWRAGGYRALKGEQARDNLVALSPLIIEQLSQAENPDAALIAFDRFLAGLRAGGRFFSLLRRNPELIRFVAMMLGVAPRLAAILANNPHFIDPLIDPAFFGSLPDEEKLQSRLSRALAEVRGYEEMLDAVRLFGQEHMFLVGARILSGSLTAEQAGEVFASLADVLVREVHKIVEDDFVKMHGRIRGQRTAIVALGRLGAREMTASSDLDLIVIYDFDADEPASDGKRPLYGAQYFARLTQRLISALTVQTNYGVLYQVDMRLRPSGRSGPLATQIDGFADYQDKEAWAWEHMALTRARVVSGPPDFSARIEAVIRAVLCRKRDAAVIAADVVEMRSAIAREKGDADPWDLKYAAGGLIDIEFIAQYLELVHAATEPSILDPATARVLEKAALRGALAPEDAAVLRPAVRLFQDINQILRLCLPGPFEPATASPAILAILARAADLPDFPSLQGHVVETQRQVRAAFIRIFGTAP